MALIRPRNDDAKDHARQYLLQSFNRPLGMSPNAVHNIARRPAVTNAYTDLNMAVMQCEGEVTPEFKRIIGYVTSYVSGCRYCQAHTVLASARFGSTDERLNDVWNFADSPHFTAAEKAALGFAHAAAMVPNAVTDEIGEELRKHWHDDDIVEIMAVIALFGYLNRWNDSMGSALEELPIEAGEKYLGGTDWEVGKHK